MPNRGIAANVMEYIHPKAIICAAARSLSLLFRYIAYVIANHRSSVSIERV
jgi:hypothetical protein